MVKKLFLAILVITTLSVALNSNAKDDKKPILSFAKTSHTFEKVSSKDKMLTYDFEFVNTGDGNLMIYDVVSSCGCVKGDYPKNPIAPGKKGKIKVTYLNSSPGPFKKRLTVKSNAKPSKTDIFIEGWNK